VSRIIILIPCYNEEKSLPGVIADVRQVLPDGDIVVVDDGSKDRTADVARMGGAVVLQHPFNMGYGVAIQTGYKYAHANRFEYLVQIDGDGQHDPKCLKDMLIPLMSDECDFVLGSRFLDGDYRPGFARRMGMALFRGIVNLVTRARITDCTSGFQAFNRDVMEFFTRDIFPCDYPDADVLVSLHRAKFRIKEIPVVMYANAEGKSMHSGFKPLYYVLKMHLAILVTLLRSTRYFERRRT